MTIFFTTEITEKKLASILRALRVLSGKTLLALTALSLGLIIARVPLTLAVAFIVGGGLLALAVVEPLVALALMLLLGPTEPLLVAAGVMPISIGQAAFALFTGAWLLRALARRDLRWPALPITIPFAVYLFAAALSLSVSHPASPKDGATELLKWIEMYLIAGMIVSTERKRLGWVIAILLLAGMFQAGIGLWQFQFRGHGPEGFRILDVHYRAYGTLEQPNPFGGFMGMVWPLAAAISLATGFRTQINTDTTQIDTIHLETRPRKSAFNLRHLRPIIFVASSIVGLASLAALFASYSRGAWLGAAAAGTAMLIFWSRRRWIGIALAGGGIAAALLLYNLGLLPATISSRFADVGDYLQVYDVRGVHVNDSNFAIVERLAHWQAAVNMADANPIFGVGFGNYEAAYDDYRLIKWQYALGHAHNIYLNALAETGALGLAAYLILWGAIFTITIRAIDPSGFENPKGLERPLAIALLGVWTHLAVHQLLDNLYVGNLPFYIGALFGVLCILATRETPGTNRNVRFIRSIR